MRNSATAAMSWMVQVVLPVIFADTAPFFSPNGAQLRAAADAAEGHPGMPSDEEVNAAAKVFCGGVWNGFDPDSMMPTEQFDRFWNDGEGHQLYRSIARHALIAARMSILAGQTES